MFDAAACSFDGGTGTSGRNHPPKNHCFRKRTARNHLHPSGALGNEPGRLERIQIDLLQVELGESIEAHFIDEATSAGHETELRQTALERHLTAFVTGAGATPRTRLLPLVPPSTSLALAGSDATTGSPTPTPRSRSRMKIVEVHGLSSLLHPEQIRHRVDHATYTGSVLHLHCLMPPPQPQTAHALEVSLCPSVHATEQRNLQPFASCLCRHCQRPVTSSKRSPRFAATR